MILIPYLSFLSSFGIAYPTLQPARKIVRLDRNSFDELSLTTFEFDSELEPEYADSSLAVPKPLLANQSFVFNLSCLNVTQVQCDGAKRALVLAGQKIAEIINFKQTVVVEAKYGPFCAPENVNCSESRKLGSALASSFFAGIRGVGSKQTKLYPQALVKQMSLDTPLQFSGVDIKAQFNSEVNFYFPSSSKNITTIGKDQFDLAYVAAHGLII